MKIDKIVIIRIMFLLMMLNCNTDVIHIVGNCCKQNNKLMLKCSSVTFVDAAGSPLSTRSLAIVDSSADEVCDEARV